uniref:Uncharacterized protein n=1 Tax=Triticum urartu TaxID=4572 RepID=A0A8R7UDH1_TRIUA
MSKKNLVVFHLRSVSSSYTSAPPLQGRTTLDSPRSLTPSIESVGTYRLLLIPSTDSRTECSRPASISSSSISPVSASPSSFARRCRRLQRAPDRAHASRTEAPELRRNSCALPPPPYEEIAVVVYIRATSVPCLTRASSLHHGRIHPKPPPSSSVSGDRACRVT